MRYLLPSPAVIRLPRNTSSAFSASFGLTSWLVAAHAASANELTRIVVIVFTMRAMRPNDPGSATRPRGRVDCNPDKQNRDLSDSTRSAMAGFAAAHG